MNSPLKTSSFEAPHQEIMSDLSVDIISSRLIHSLKEGGLSQALNHSEYPAYLVNASLEVAWKNEAATPWLGDFVATDATDKPMHVLQQLARGKYGQRADNQSAFNKLHWEAGKSQFQSKNDPLRDLSEPRVFKPDQSPFSILLRHGEREDAFLVDVTCYREGMLFVFNPQPSKNSSAQLLSKGDQSELKEIAILMARIRGFSSMTMQLPPEAHFDLVCQLRELVNNVFDKHHGLSNGQMGALFSYCFIGEENSSYLMNALSCAFELRQAVDQLSHRWQAEKDWSINIGFDIAIHQGQEWISCLRNQGTSEVLVLGETAEKTLTLLDECPPHAILASKAVLTKLDIAQRRSVRYGVRRLSDTATAVYSENLFMRTNDAVNGSLMMAEVIDFKPE